MMDKERGFLDQVRRVLDDSVENLDGATRSRLAQARNAALDGKRRLRRRVLAWGTPAAGLAAAAIAVALMLPSTITPVDESYVDDLDILASEESIEFYEDIEFYQWLSEVEKNEDEISRDGGGASAPVATGSNPGPESGDGRRIAEHGDAGLSRHV